MTENKENISAGTNKNDRKDRLAKQLRDNLRKRKVQTKAQSANQSTKDSSS